MRDATPEEAIAFDKRMFAGRDSGPAIRPMPPMTPEQLVFWLRGLATAGPVSAIDAPDLISAIFSHALHAHVEPPTPTRSGCGCGGPHAR